MTPKITKCCYCGHRAALVLKDLPGGRHELACAACGAPLHEMKAVPTEHPPQEKPHLVTPSKVRGTKKPKTSKKKKRKGGGLGALGGAAFGVWAVKELIDAVEDVFD